MTAGPQLCDMCQKNAVVCKVTLTSIPNGPSHQPKTWYICGHHLGKALDQARNEILIWVKGRQKNAGCLVNIVIKPSTGRNGQDSLD